jgi:hypothetical protein
MAAKQAQAPSSPEPSTEVAKVNSDKQAVAEYNRTYTQRYLDDVAPSGIAGRLIKFKDSEYQTADDGKVLPGDDEYILLADDPRSAG